MSISEDSLLQRLRTDVLWHRRRGNETIAKDIEEAEARLSKAIDLLKEAHMPSAHMSDLDARIAAFLKEVSE